MQLLRFRRHGAAGFTLIELLVVISIIGLLLSILIPSLTSARRAARATVCMTRLRTAGQGMVIYGNDHKDTLVPARLPKLDDYRWRARVVGGWKYRPTFLTLMDSAVGLPAFEEPLASRKEVDKFGQPGDRQNYSSEQYVCPEVSDWVDERNGAYGYNYHFLGNARLRDKRQPNSFKNWPVKSSQVRTPSECVAVADSMGTAASFPRRERRPYEDNAFGDSRSGRTLSAFGNEGFNLDPPRVDTLQGEMAGFDDEPQSRTAIHERHGGRGAVLWIDGHTSLNTLESLRYRVREDGVVTFDGDNRFFSINRSADAWTE